MILTLLSLSHSPVQVSHHLHPLEGCKCEKAGLLQDAHTSGDVP